MAKHDLNDIVGVSELAAEHKVSPQAISNWVKRYDDFPKPLKVLAMGPLYSRKAVRAWTGGS